jgi:S-DNA-T family DNA segregation ATPase FtsK/SpoIIIE
MKLLIKQFMIVMVIVSGILNFPIIDGEIIKYEKLGGYVSRPVIFILDALFGGKALAVKVFIIIALIVAVIWILYSLNFSLPKLNIHLHQDERPKDKQKRETGNGKRNNDEEEEEEEEKAPQTIDQGFIRTLIKDKFKKEITQKIDAKEAEKRMRSEESTDSKKEKKTRNAISYSSEKPTYSISLLDTNPGEAVTIDEAFLMEKAKALQDKLLEFNVPITIEGFDIGPSIVQIRIKPDSGIRIATLEGLTHDIALSLKSKSLRIVAPIPGTDCVGIQLPNPKPMMVRLGDILSAPDFAADMKKSDNNLSLGKAIDGSIVTKTLESMPHLLVAGATGSGKSVGVNDFILSLMYQNTPSELKFLMVDPKQVELELYSGLPYMLAPIVFESDKALKLLKWTVQEMENRYGLLREKRVKNITEYNDKII